MFQLKHQNFTPTTRGTDL
uniref:Uncharacterized protein n=1 Tax=Arundo donax TaxID=35708 RepID=A0A0A9GRF7_ARUDO